MTIDKAIELLNLYEHAASSIARDDFLAATKMGISALKQLKALRQTHSQFKTLKLHGETWDTPRALSNAEPSHEVK